MRKYSLTFLFFIFNFSFLLAQKRQIDSLQSVLKTVKEDTNKVNLLNSLSERLKEVSNYDSSLIDATTASLLAEKLDFKKGLAIALRSMAVANWSKSNYPIALEYATKALKLNQEIKNETGIAADYSSISAIYEEEGDYP
ncbi:MAG TPA: hypothetical protein VN922_16795, partial [Bacteroidia bacterium]|nr:hypothetical protein [Bacteroidia bacterium]